MTTITDPSVPAALSIEDSLAIAGVLVRYAVAIDQRNWALLRTCFTDDFIGKYESPRAGQFKHWSSGDDITQAMIATHASFGPTLHRLSNIVSHPSAFGATAHSYVDAVLMPRASGPVRQATGTYDDALVRHAGDWRIVRREFTLVRLVQLEELA